MATYALTVSTDALGLGVINGARVRVEKRRVSIADTYPPINNLIYIEQSTNSSGITTFLLEPDDTTTYHLAKIYDLAGIFIYQKFFTMPPEVVNLEDSAIGVVIGGSLIQFKDEGVDLGTPTTVRNVDFVGEGVEATFTGDKVSVAIEAGYKGFVAITDITPTNISDNVGNKVKTDDDNVLQTCTSSTTAVTVSVLATTGKTSFKPSVSVNGTAATLTRNSTTDVWQGTAAITLIGSSPHTVLATHVDGATDSAIITIEAAPVIDSIVFSGAYSQGIGQTEHAAGQTLSLTITSSTPFVEYEIIGDGTTAIAASSATFAAATSKTVSVTVANHGNTPTAYPAKARIRNANGTWSAITASNASASANPLNVVTLNNTQPVVSFGAITYPATQFALKGSESATVAVTESNVSTVSYTSPGAELSIASPTVLGNKTVTRIAGGYNISVNNLQVTATKTSNATSAIFSTVVWIADDSPSVSIATPAARLRSGVSAQPHTITLTATQRVSDVSLSNSAGFGSFVGSWVSADSGLTWTKVLQVADIDTKGAATFSGLSVKNLAGKVGSTITAGASYMVGGFVARTVTMPATPNRELVIGTLVVDTSLVRVINFSKGGAGVPMSYQGSTADGVDKFTITDGNTKLYNCDAANAGSNFSGTAQFSIEELVS